MPLGGFFVYQQKLNFYILVFWGVFGPILGSMPWYYMGKLVNEKRLANFLDKRGKYIGCLLYTSDAADDLTRVDLGGRRIIKKSA